MLNSNLYYFWLYYKGKRKGNALELYQQPLSEIPIKKLGDLEQKPFIEIVNRILELTNTEDYLQNKGKQVKVKEFEKQINLLVYGLYKLTAEEINVVEGSVNHDRKAGLDEGQDVFDTITE